MNRSKWHSSCSYNESTSCVCALLDKRTPVICPNSQGVGLKKWVWLMEWVWCTQEYKSLWFLVEDGWNRTGTALGFHSDAHRRWYGIESQFHHKNQYTAKLESVNIKF